MTESEKIKLKSGLEIHQQLDTNKLFCPCPSILKSEEPDIVVKRKLYPVAGETGELDAAVEFERGRDRQFVYEAYTNSTCLVELDEEPPHLINEEALKIALQISLLLNAKPFSIIQVMRKTVINGSNTSGFQRTLLLARNGWLEIKGKKIGIATICLEEDAARIIKQDKNEVVYRLDRLGIPLVEIATTPDISSAEEAKEVALALGEIFRACKVKRGIGTIRQDVNMSVCVEGKWGSRIEIKGVQEPWLIQKTIETETERQVKLIKQKKSVAEVRNAEADGSTSFLRPLPGKARMYPETDLPLIKISNDMINEIKKNLPKLRYELKHELKEKGLSEEMIKLLLKENKLVEYKILLPLTKKPNLIVKMLVLWPKEISSHKKIPLEKVNKLLTFDIIETILELVGKGKLDEAYIKHIMTEIVMGKSLEEAIKKEKLNLNELEKEIQQLVREKPGLGVNAYMGFVMQKHRGKVNASEIVEIIKKYVK